MINKTEICVSKRNLKKESKPDYYKAYEKRYSQVYENNMLWSAKENTPDVLNCIKNYKINKKSKILDLGCGEGRDAICLLNNGYNVMAVDYSQTVIEKCKQLSNNKYNEHFIQLDLINDKMNCKFDFIYSIAVLHMFVLNEHRDKFLSFVREHLKNDGICLICVLGDGNREYVSNIDEAFKNIKRTVMNNNAELEIAATSCKIVNWEQLECEIINNGLKIEQKWISNNIPEFDSSMCVVVKRGDL